MPAEVAPPTSDAAAPTTPADPVPGVEESGAPSPAEPTAGSSDGSERASARAVDTAIPEKNPPPAPEQAPDAAGSISAQPRRVRAALARLAPKTGQAGPAAIEPVLKLLRAHHPKDDLRSVVRAYEVAEEAHRGQLRRSGEAYITHPVGVATILAELGMDPSTIVAALLHDVVEDTPATLETVRVEFGDLVARLVDGVTKLDKVKFGEVAEAESIRKMVIAMARDSRVLVVKLADRLHNMRTISALPRDKQERISRETLEIYAPLAHRLGMNTIKWELEDLGFATLYPKRYDEIVRLVSDRAPSRDTYISGVIEQIAESLKEQKVRATVSGRPKHYYSIYQKMIVRGHDFSDIHDLLGVRVLVDSVRDCYAALGTIHSLWNPVPGRFKDYIARPKFNMYQSLHTTVIGPEGKPFELQIRTFAMHNTAEIGIAAHWKYKDGGGAAEAKNDMQWMRQLLDWQKETADPGEFLDSLRFDLFAGEVFVFTPKGDVISLPTGATSVDFAYAVHTEVGHRCIGARVNNRLVPLESPLDNGDVVEVFTSKAANYAPSQDWLAFVKTPRARNKIRQWFAKERRDDAIEEGKDAIARAMRKQGLPLQRLLSGDALATLAKDLRHPDVTALYAAVGESQISAQTIVARLVQALGGAEGAVEDLAEVARPLTSRPKARPVGDPGVIVKGASDVWVKLSKCCTPVPGDPIVGFVTRGNGVSVHRGDCVNAKALEASQPRFVDVEWSPTAASIFLVAIQVEALDRTRLLSDVTRALSDQHVNILSASVTTTRDRVAVSRFTFEMADPTHLGHLLKAVRSVEGVYDAYRVVSGKQQ